MLQSYTFFPLKQKKMQNNAKNNWWYEKKKVTLSQKPEQYNH